MNKSITLLYFASIRSALPNEPSTEIINLPSTPFPLSSLRSLLASHYPGNEELVRILAKSAWSVEEEMVGREEEGDLELKGGETVCAIPPVSGG